MKLLVERLKTGNISITAASWESVDNCIHSFAIRIQSLAVRHQVGIFTNFVQPENLNWNWKFPLPPCNISWFYALIYQYGSHVHSIIGLLGIFEWVHNTGSDAKIRTSLYKWAWKILSRDCDLSCSDLLHGQQMWGHNCCKWDAKLSNSYRLLTLNPWSY